MTYLIAGCRLLEFWIRHEHVIQRDALFTWRDQMWRSVATQAGVREARLAKRPPLQTLVSLEGIHSRRTIPW
jgi:hypothetical protein